MPTKLIVAAADRNSKAVKCTFTVQADEVTLVAKDRSQQIYELPTGTKAVRITATPMPKPHTHWETIVALAVAGNGTITPGAGFPPWVSVKQASGATGGAVLATVRVSRFRDVTPTVFTLLQTVPLPRGPRAPLESHLAATYGKWPPPNLDIHELKNAHYLDAQTPVSGGAPNLATDASLRVEEPAQVLELAGVAAPRLFGVVWPRAMTPKANSGPTSMLLFVRQTGWQDGRFGIFVGDGVKGQPYPFNFDYAERCLYESMHYGPTPLAPAFGFSLRPKGVPYQVAKSGARAVSVFPVAHAVDSIGYGAIANMNQTQAILEELQAFMFWQSGVVDPPTEVGRTAIAAYSSANGVLVDWVFRNTASSFFQNKVKALYFLDPPDVPSSIKAGISWAGKPDTDRRVRIYSRGDNGPTAENKARKAAQNAAFKTLLGVSALPAEPFLQSTSDNRRTVGVFPETSWVAAFKKAFPSSRPVKVAWWDAHHYIPATVLTHALAQGDI